MLITIIPLFKVYVPTVGLQYGETLIEWGTCRLQDGVVFVFSPVVTPAVVVLSLSYISLGCLTTTESV